MSVAELVQEIRRMSNADRLRIIEAATALVREDLVAESAKRRGIATERMRAASLQAKELYEPGGELTDWTVLDGEEVLDGSVGGHVNHPVKG